MRYRTIVADPPWRYAATLPEFGDVRGARTATPYPTMTVAEIAALDVDGLAAKDAHLYLWTTNHHLEHVWDIARGWGFTPKTLLVWTKNPRGRVGFPTFTCATEYVLFAYRGVQNAKSLNDRNWWTWPRGEHSAKPEAFLDLVEATSHGPYLEMFARRQRLGWDTWGNEALQHVEMATA